MAGGIAVRPPWTSGWFQPEVESRSRFETTVAVLANETAPPRDPGQVVGCKTWRIGWPPSAGVLTSFLPTQVLRYPDGAQKAFPRQSRAPSMNERSVEASRRCPLS